MDMKRLATGSECVVLNVRAAKEMVVCGMTS